MDRSNFDPFWNDVVKMDDGRMKCKFCGHLFAKGTSISRIKWHLSGNKGHGVAICGQVPKEVQEAALQAMRDGNKRQKTIASSSNVNDNVVSSCPQEENNEVDNLAPDVGRIQMAIQGTELGVGEGRTSSCAEAGNHMENTAGEMMHSDTSITAEEPIVDAHETREEASQALDILSQSIERSWDDIYKFVTEDDIENGIGGVVQPHRVGQALGISLGEIHNFLFEDDIENGTGGVAQPGAGASSSGGGLTRNTKEIKGDALPTTNLVGEAFEDHKKTIWSWLMNDEVSSIGIYGMGGVGKTTLVTHIYKELLHGEDIFPYVYWITVSQDFSINRLQNSIAKRIGLDLSNEEEELHRAAKLSEELMTKEKWVLILDDLWNYFDLHKVGVPFQAKACKVILTTRSEKVCRQMDSQKKIKVKPLSKEEAWTLFKEKLGHDIPLSAKVETIARLITDQCDGLPLGIVTMAGAMKGVDDICEWKNALDDLTQSRFGHDDMEEKVFRVLRFSYMHLKDSALQQCFLYCSLFPEDFEIPREYLIDYLIDEGVIKRLHRREAEFEKAHSMLNILENVCLLESVPSKDGRYVKMHDLIRDMAIQIQHRNFEVMVESGVQLEELPDVEEWTESLVRVSLMQNRIEKIPSSHSPKCPRLLTLLLCHNWLQSIEDSFFEQLHGLKVLDLSYTSIEKLSDSVFNLVNLNALLLKNCVNLRHVPSLKKLRTLKRLDLSGSTALEKVPQGMECLSNLRYLRLNVCGEKEFPSGILPKLLNLQVLVLEEDNMSKGYAPITLKGKEVACLRKLETLECHFEGHSEFVEYVKSRDKTQSLCIYQIFVGQLDEDDYRRMKYDFCRQKSVGLGKFNINRDGDFQIMFPNDIEELIVCNCNEAIRSLCDGSSLKDATKPEIIRILYCNSMESFVSSSWFCSYQIFVGQLDEDDYRRMKNNFCRHRSCRQKMKIVVLLLR